MEYKKLTEEELSILHGQLSGYFGANKRYAKFVSLVTKYFTNPHSILIKVDSEYNDNTYDNRLAGVFVYDENEVECGLSRTDRDKFTKELDSLYFSNETDEPSNDVVVYVTESLPVIYKKVK